MNKQTEQELKKLYLKYHKQFCVKENCSRKFEDFIEELINIMRGMK